MGDNHKVVKEELKEALRQELTAEPAPKEEAHGEEMEEMMEEPEPARPSWEEFLAFWDKSPAVYLEDGVNKALAKRLNLDPEDVKNSRLVPAVAYIPAYYLWPYLSSTSESEIPEPFRPLLKSVMALGGAVLKKKLEAGLNAGQTLPATG